ncbi:MAG: DUF1273 family protein [Clostridia bacterium]|nr:DUF1273 family protein [Clostridia bacterium]
MKVCFIGHRTIEKTERLMFLLKEIVLKLIKEGATTFLFGSNSAFDDLSWKVVTELKKEYSFIKRVYVRSAYQHIDTAYEKYLLKSYEETYFPEKIEKAGKSSYIKRNYEMIDKSTCCVFYYNEKYEPQAIVKSKSKMLLSPKRNSGTKIAYNYALKKKKQIINLFE